MNLKKKILFVGFPNSIHVENWINSIDFKIYDIFFFPTSHKNFLLNKKNIFYSKNFKVGLFNKIFFFTLNLISFKKLIFMPKIFLKQLTHNKYILSTFITYLKPDIIHCFEFQHAGYLLHDALKENKFNQYKLILSNYGSDIFHYEKFKFHKKKIKEILNFFDEIVCESKRDIHLCKKYNPQIKTHLILNSAGINFKVGNLVNLRLRKNIIIKGYQGKFGRYFLILSYLKKLKSEFTYKTIYVYSSNSFTRIYTNLFYSDLKIVFLPQMTKKKLMYYFKKSVIYIGASISDGVSTSALDSISTKTFPLQSNTATLYEIFHESSIIFKLHDFKDFKKKLLFVINNQLQAQNIINKIYIKSKHYDNKIVKSKIMGLYS